jgi:hypothetical protein
VGGVIFGLDPIDSSDCPIAKLQQHVIANKIPALENPFSAICVTFHPPAGLSNDAYPVE